MNINQIVCGECDGTGAAINVCLGFVPQFIILMNLEDGGGQTAWAFWHKAMEQVSALDEGIKITAADMTQAKMAANGISAYAGGDEMIYDGVTDNQWENSAGSSVEEGYVDGRYIKGSLTPAYRCYGDAVEDNPRHGTKVKTVPGFTIGPDSDLNVNGEQLCWIVFR